MCVSGGALVTAVLRHSMTASFRTDRNNPRANPASAESSTLHERRRAPPRIPGRLVPAIVHRSTSEAEYGYSPTEPQPWESYLINPHRVGLGVSNAMSQLCYDRTQKAWRYDYGEWVEIRSTYDIS